MTWLQSLKVYLEATTLRMLALGFSVGLPLLLVQGILRFRIREAGIDRATIGFLTWVGWPMASSGAGCRWWIVGPATYSRALSLFAFSKTSKPEAVVCHVRMGVKYDLLDVDLKASNDESNKQ